MTLKELREKSARAIAEARALIDALKTDSTAEARAEAHRQADAFLTEAQGYDGQITTLERLEQFEARSRAATEGQRPIIGGVQGEQRSTKSKEESEAEYREAFRQLILAHGQAHEMPAEQRAILQAGYRSAGSPEFRAQSAGSNTAGGYTVPTTLRAAIDKAMVFYGPMWDEQVCTVLSDNSGNPYLLPTVDDTSKTGAAKAENADLTTTTGSDAVIGQARLDGYTFSTPDFIRISVELAMDSALPFETVVSMLVAERMGRLANAQLTTGTGSSAPNGIVTASTLGKTTAAVAAVTADEILQFLHSVDPAYRAQPKFGAMFNDATLLALRLLKDGQGNYLIRDDRLDLQNKLVIGSATVPYKINQAVASLGTGNKFMVMGDFSKYFVRKIGGTTIGLLRERFWPDLGLAAFIRLDGEAINTAAIKHMKNA